MTMTKQKRYAQTEKGKACRRRGHLKAKYHMTIESFERLFAKQGERCAACKSTEHRESNWHVDYDHGSGKVRGILCYPCNLSLRLAQESAERLEGLLSYLSIISKGVTH